MIERKPLRELKENYKKTTVAINKIPECIDFLNRKMRGLDPLRRISYSNDVCRIGISRKRLETRALPVLVARRKQLEEEIVKEMPDNTKVKTMELFSLRDGRYLPADIFTRAFLDLTERAVKQPSLKNTKEQANSGSNSIRVILTELGYDYASRYPGRLSKSIRRVAGEVLGREVRERFCCFTDEEKERIIEACKKIGMCGSVNGKAKEKMSKKQECKVLVLGEEIKFSRHNNAQMKLLVSLLGSSEEKPVLKSELAEVLSGKAAPGKDNEDNCRMRNAIYLLRCRLKTQGLSIVYKNIGEDGAYYLSGRPSIPRKKMLKLDVFDTETEKLRPKFFLNEREIFAVVSKFLRIAKEDKSILSKNGIKTDTLSREEVRTLMKRTNLDHASRKAKFASEEEDVLLSARRKLDVFIRNPEKYFSSSSIEAQCLLSCFYLKDIWRNGVLDKLLSANGSRPQT